jgi:hypothetical protein
VELKDATVLEFLLDEEEDELEVDDAEDTPED